MSVPSPTLVAMALTTSLESPAPVRQIATAISAWVDRLGVVWVEGQIAQLSRRPGLNTVFMTLRDTLADVSISVTCPRTLFDGLNPPVVEGASVVIQAKPSFYALRGSLSLQAREIRMVGLGELLARIERRRQLLAAEGLFAMELKRKLPFLPHTVGLVTSPGSDAERDVIENSRRRWPSVRVKVAAARMQGQHSPLEVTAALQELDADPEVEVIVIARGGGSVEDLLPFSDEGLVRAVHKARTPVVSAIGHEADQPLLDLVADLRASTPTDAARRVVPDMAEETLRVDQARQRIRHLMGAWLDREEAGLAAIRSRPAMADPRNLLDDRSAEVAQLRDRARRSVRHRLDRADDEILHHAARATALSPLATLRRGYAVVQRADGHVLASVDEVAPGDALSVRVADGRVHAITTDIENATPLVEAEDEEADA